MASQQQRSSSSPRGNLGSIFPTTSRLPYLTFPWSSGQLQAQRGFNQAFNQGRNQGQGQGLVRSQSYHPAYDQTSSLRRISQYDNNYENENQFSAMKYDNQGQYGAMKYDNEDQYGAMKYDNYGRSYGRFSQRQLSFRYDNNNNETYRYDNGNRSGRGGLGSPRGFYYRR